MPLIRSTLALLALSWVTAGNAADQKQACVDASTQGQQLRLDGKLVAAREAFRACTDAACPSPVRSACGDWLVEVDKALPTIVIAARDPAGKDLKVRRVSIDGAPSLEAALGRAVAIDPGKHAIDVELEDGAVAKEAATVAEGEKNRIVLVTFVPRKTIETPKPVPPSTARGPWPWVFGAVGVAGLASFAGFGTAAWLGARDLRSRCEGSCSSSEVSAVRTKLLVADISLGVGLVGAGVATFLFLRTPSAASGVSGTTLGLGVGPRGVTLTGWF